MNVRNTLAGTWLVIMIQFGVVSPAMAVTLVEYNGLNPQQRADLVAVVLNAYYNRYNGNPDTAFKANCMVELYKPVVESEGSHLINLIFSQLEIALNNSDLGGTVEGVAELVINRECKAP